jgi:hypothetical protein
MFFLSLSLKTTALDQRWGCHESFSAGCLRASPCPTQAHWKKKHLRLNLAIIHQESLDSLKYVAELAFPGDANIHI